MCPRTPKNKLSRPTSATHQSVYFIKAVHSRYWFHFLGRPAATGCCDECHKRKTSGFDAAGEYSFCSVCDMLLTSGAFDSGCKCRFSLAHRCRVPRKQQSPHRDPSLPVHHLRARLQKPFERRMQDYTGPQDRKRIRATGRFRNSHYQRFRSPGTITTPATNAFSGTGFGHTNPTTNTFGAAGERLLLLCPATPATTRRMYQQHIWSGRSTSGGWVLALALEPQARSDNSSVSPRHMPLDLAPRITIPTSRALPPTFSVSFVLPLFANMDTNQYPPGGAAQPAATNTFGFCQTQQRAAAVTTSIFD